MLFNVVTLFPHLLQSLRDSGVIGQALQKRILDLNIVNPRDFTEDAHKTVDDRPYGGGDGMVLLAEPFRRALDSLEKPGKIVALTARGRVWDHQLARQWSRSPEAITLVCGRYAGFDQRFIEKCVDEEISIGDFIVSGGEWPACLIIDSVARYLPGVLGHPDSAYKESFETEGLEAPQFTRPAVWEGLPVPEILKGGHHQQIEDFRSDIAWLLTLRFRPDLVKDSGSKRLLQAKARWESLSLEERQALGLKDLDFLNDLKA